MIGFQGEALLDHRGAVHYFQDAVQAQGEVAEGLGGRREDDWLGLLGFDRLQLARSGH